MMDNTPKEAMKQIFSYEASIQRWMDVEAALARAEAAVDMIPKYAAEEISRKTKVELLDLKKFEETRQKTLLPTIAFVRTFATICEGDAGQYIHWAFCSPDLVDTAQMLRLRDAHKVIYQSLRRIEADLLNMTEEHADTIMAGRSHNIQASPITFGYKVATWAREIRRHIHRLKECRERLFMVQVGGAMGTMTSFGSKGPEVQSLMAKDLGLGVPDICWHQSRDRVAEFVNLLSIIAGTLGRIANQVFILMHTEIGEVAEPWQKGYVGSSTLPHKINPFISEFMISLAKKIRYNAALVNEFMVVEHEHDLWFLTGEMESSMDACLSMGELLTHGENMAKNMTVNPKRMRANLGILKGLMQSEAVMLELGHKIGRQSAHELINEHALKAVQEDIDFKGLLMKDARVTQHLTEAEIDYLLKPEHYVGLAPQITRDMVALSRKEREED